MTGTRADFGKIKPLIAVAAQSNLFDVHIFATGMHMSVKHGYTVDEVVACGFSNIYMYINGVEGGLSIALANTISGFSHYVKMVQPDMIVIHGDRVEALAGALVGSLNNILVSHIEGGEISGTIDEHIRHSISKLAHVHFVANEKAKQRLVQMGESTESIFVIGSPDLDVMNSEKLPSLTESLRAYDVPFKKFGILLYHPVTTDTHLDILKQINILIDALIDVRENHIVIYPNSDPGSDIILDAYRQRLASSNRFKILPSIRFERFLTLMKNSQYIIGNSSAGIREAPFYGIPSINIGSRQNKRSDRCSMPSVYHCGYDYENIHRLIVKAGSHKKRYKSARHFGDGSSGKKFITTIKNPNFWKTKIQKQFLDIDD